MSVIEKPEFSSKRTIPVSMKLILMIAVIIGIWGRSCWRANERANIIFDNVIIEELTPVSVEFSFEVENNTSQSGNKAILIKVFTDRNELVSSRITNVNIIPGKRQKHFRVIDRFDRAIRDDEKIGRVEVYLYQKSAFSS